VKEGPGDSVRPLLQKNGRRRAAQLSANRLEGISQEKGENRTPVSVLHVDPVPQVKATISKLVAQRVSGVSEGLCPDRAQVR